MVLFSPSTVNNASVQKGMSAVSNLQALGNKVAPKATAAISTAIGNAADGVLGSVGGVIKSGESSVGGALSSAVNYVVGGVSDMFSSLDKSLSSSVTGSIGNVFGDSSNTAAANVKTATPDAVKSSFANGTPQPTAFTTNPINSTVTGLKLAQGSAPTAAQQAQTAAHKTDLLSQLFQTGTSVAPSNGTVAQKVLTGANLLTTTSSPLSSGAASLGTSADSILSTGAKETSSNLNSVLKSLGIDASAGTAAFDATAIQSSVPTIDASSGAINSNTAQVPASTLNNILNLAQKLGCGTGGVYVATGTNQSTYNALLAIASKLGLADIVSTMTQCAQYTSTTQGTAAIKELFNTSAENYPAVGLSLLNAISPSNASVSTTTAQAIVTNPNATTTSDAAAINAILQKARLSSSQVYGTGTTVAGSTVWDSSVLNSSNKIVSDTVTGNRSVSSLASTTPVALDSSGAVDTTSLLGTATTWPDYMGIY